MTCTIDSVTSVSFGLYDVESPENRTSSGELRFHCKPSKTMTIKVTAGPSAVSGSINDRQMRGLGSGDQMQYNLFLDSRGTAIWGDGENGGSAAFVTGHKDYVFEFYGVLRAQQQISEGLYADVLRITVLP